MAQINYMLKKKMTDNPEIMRLLTKMHEEKGLDFTQYKDDSILRRIHSRMSKYNEASYDEYIKILESNPDEYKELINALAINVTEFFRNPESFNAIDKIVIPRVIYSKGINQHRIIRALSCGCSSGDEPYSLAILLLEKLGGAKTKYLVNITGMDIDKDALEEAQNMVYSKNRLKVVSEKLFDEYFDKLDNDKYKLKSHVKNLVKFRHSNIITDAPLMHCDIILCRNLLIYFNKQLQEEVLLKFYECLNPGGFLVLGMVETLVGSAADVFEIVDNRLRIYRRPETGSLKPKGGSTLSQCDIDKIVKEMLE
jgi:chemotaxis protein methyltransferase CheR